MSLILPGGSAPSNLRTSARYVESDLYSICDRVKEIDLNLTVVELDQPDLKGNKYAVVEHCSDGVERLVFMVRAGELDARVVEKLRYLAAVPLNERMDEYEKMEHQWEADRKEAEHEKLWEELGGPMRIELARNGFLRGGGHQASAKRKGRRR